MGRLVQELRKQEGRCSRGRGVGCGRKGMTGVETRLDSSRQASLHGQGAPASGVSVGSMHRDAAYVRVDSLT